MIMKEKIIKFGLPLLLLFLSLGVSAQEITVEVMGKSTVKLSPRHIIVELTFEENGRSCGPNTNFESIGEQVAFFFDELNKAGLNSKYTFKEVDEIQYYSNQYKRSIYAFMVNDDDVAKQIYDIGKFSFAERINFYIEYPNFSVADDLKAANDALENAKEKANILMKALGKKNVELIAIDDNTSRIKGGIYYDSMNWNKRQLNANQERFRSMGYLLKVKFKIY